MEEIGKKILYGIGAILLIYVVFRFIIPMFFAVLGIFLYVIMWIAMALVVIFVVSHIVRTVKEK